MKTMARERTKEIGTVPRRGDWRSVPYAAGAAYAHSENQMIIPYGVLDGWWFDVDRPEVLNIATLSLAINHEITHGFDNQGSQYDQEGILIFFNFTAT